MLLTHVQSTNPFWHLCQIQVALCEYTIETDGLHLCLLEDDQKEKSLSHHTIQQLIMEKDQALADLNSVEKSLADLFRRYEKMKDVLEGFRKVTDTNDCFQCDRPR